MLSYERDLKDLRYQNQFISAQLIPRNPFRPSPSPSGGEGIACFSLVPLPFRLPKLTQISRVCS